MAVLAPHTVADTQSDSNDGQITAGQRLLGDQLDAADDNGGEHHNGCATQNRLGHDGNQRTQLGAQAAQDQEDGTGGNGEAVDNLGHGNQTNVLAEGGIGQNTEERCEGRTDTVADDTAGQLLVGSFTAQTAFHNAGDVADRFHCGNDEHDYDGQNCTHIKNGLYGHDLGNFEPGSIGNLIPVQDPCLGVLHTVSGNTGGGQNQTHDERSQITAGNAQQDGGRTGEALGAVLEVQNHSQHEDCQQQVLHGTKVLGGVAAAEGVDTNGDQAQTNGHNHSAGNNSGEEFTQRLQEETQDTFKQAADDGCAHNGTVGDDTAAHGSCNGIENTQEAGGGTHNDGDIAADGADGEQLNQSNDTCDQHRVLQQVQLQFCKFATGDAAGAGDDQQGGQVADKHGQNVLQTQRDSLGQRHLSVQLEGFFRQFVSLLHSGTSFIYVFTKVIVAF